VIAFTGCAKQCNRGERGRKKGLTNPNPDEKAFIESLARATNY